jgi:uncharacterized protein (DUF4415 family)
MGHKTTAAGWVGRALPTVLDWFKAPGNKGYQTCINALVRAYREAHTKG